MAEGFYKKILPKANVFSAGIETHGVNTKAIEVMSEIGIDISTHTSNQLEEYREIKFTHIITVCDNANETCPYFLSGGKVSSQFFRSNKVYWNRNRQNE